MNTLPKKSYKGAAWPQGRLISNPGDFLIGASAGLGLGAALMSLFDPNSGRRRRALLRDKAVHLEKQGSAYLGKATRDLSNRVKGTVAEMKSPKERPEQPKTSKIGKPAPGQLLGGAILLGLIGTILGTVRATSVLSEREAQKAA